MLNGSPNASAARSWVPAGRTIGPLDGSPPLVVAGVLAQGLDRSSHERLQRRRVRLPVSGAVTHQTGPQQRVARQQGRSAQVSQRLSHGVVELRLGEDQQRRLDRRRQGA